MAVDVDYAELLADYLETGVWGGFQAEKDVVEDALEGLEEGYFSDEPVPSPDERAVRAAVRAAFARKEADERTWPAETDCDRLTRCFEQLTARGILALENAGYTMSDGWSELDDVAEREWRPRGARPRGGCFYHGQDLERAVAGNGLHLAFSAQRGADGEGVAGEIVAALREHGFEPEWSGKASQRIFLPIRWQRRLRPPSAGS